MLWRNIQPREPKRLYDRRDEFMKLLRSEYKNQSDAEYSWNALRGQRANWSRGTSEHGLTPANGNKALKYDCDKCIAYCCSIYDRVQVTPRDIRRLAAHFRVLRKSRRSGLPRCSAKKEFCGAKPIGCLARPACFWIRTRASAPIYHARPLYCREFPTTSRCAYYDLIEFEREQQNDPDVMPLVKITFKNGNE